MNDTIKLYTYCFFSIIGGVVQLLEHVALWIEILAGIGALVSFILAVLKFRRTKLIDHLRLENEKLDNQIKQQELYRQIEKNKNFNQNP